jgi:hypothetical protein
VESWGWNDSTSTLEAAAKQTFAYDEGNFADSGLQQNISPTQHDGTNYGSSFRRGPGESHQGHKI